jgi:hypothetical protein
MSEEANRSTQAETNTDRPELSAKPADKRPLIYGILFGLIVILILGGIAFLLYSNPPLTAIFRDIVIIFLGLGAFIIILLLIALVVITTYLVLKVNDLVQLLDQEIKPMLAKLQETVGTVRGTATFLSDHAVQPVITTVSTVSAIKAIFRALFRRS